MTVIESDTEPRKIYWARHIQNLQLFADRKQGFGYPSLLCDLGMCQNYLRHKWKVNNCHDTDHFNVMLSNDISCIVTRY